MTCPTCGRRTRAAIMLAALDRSITPAQFTRLYEATLTEDPMRHITLTHTMGDIGEDEEEWEVVPTHEPVEVPQPSEPVPA